MQVTAGPLKNAAKATAWFMRSTPTMQGYRKSTLSIPWAQMPDPVAIAPSGVLRFQLGSDLDATFDVVVPDAAVKVTLALPGGKVLPQEQIDPSTTWTTVTYDGLRSMSDPAIGMFAHLIMPVHGYHHLISIPQAAKGDYEIRASQDGKTTGELRAVLLPLRAFFDGSVPPPPGQVRMRRTFNVYETFAGEQLDLKVGLLGEGCRPARVSGAGRE